MGPIRPEAAAVRGKCNQAPGGMSQVGAEKADVVPGRARAPPSRDVTFLFGEPAQHNFFGICFFLLFFLP